MDVSKTQPSSQANLAASSNATLGSTASGKSPEKEDKAKSLDIGFKEKVAQPQAEGKGENLAGRTEQAHKSFVACSIITCGCE